MHTEYNDKFQQQGQQNEPPAVKFNCLQSIVC